MTDINEEFNNLLKDKMVEIENMILEKDNKKKMIDINNINY